MVIFLASAVCLAVTVVDELPLWKAFVPFGAGTRLGVRDVAPLCNFSVGFAHMAGWTDRRSDGFSMKNVAVKAVFYRCGGKFTTALIVSH